MGHGVQMWLQIMWFLTHATAAGTVILDEPDVYMHPDLQRRLARFLRDRFSQVVLTTHSVEIMSEVDPGEISVIDRRMPRAKFAGNLPAVQRILEGVGSAQNIHLARLWSARKMILVEGKDLKLLRYFRDRLFPDANEAFDAVPNMAIGGWDGWSYALGGSMLLQNAMGEDIKVYCVLDSDYHTPEEIAARYVRAMEKGVHLHIWRRKEIENYLLSANAIARLISTRCAHRNRDVAAETVSSKIDQLATETKEAALDGMSSAIFAQDKRLQLGTANKRARDWLSGRSERDGLLSVVSGKDIISGLSSWSQKEFKVSLTAGAIAREMKRNEVPEEIAAVVTAIEFGKTFEKPRGNGEPELSESGRRRRRTSPS
jgi:hypothetical protein